ncbi:SDR family NAD(P)-dependent oxidoreductase [Kineococcus sp. SYSU DK003]|uniref:SDR family NAD(P)-dependent oxidoreductase n=1 Tax=Kineococcus sp. SYSU DK003 TaxID=3383124 RepID=UPI003D7E32A1
MGTSRCERFGGWRVVVTGAGHGIGRACAQRLAEEGARVALLDLDVDAARAVLPTLATPPGDGHSAHAVDVLDPTSVDAAFAGLEVDALVHTAGGALPQRPLEESPDEEWVANLDLNLLGAVRCCRAALPALRRSPRGPSIVLVSSINALAGIGDEAYSAAKAGLGALARDLTATHARDGIRCNVVAPGTIRTRVWDDRPGMPDAWAGRYPLGRVGEPGDVAGAVAFLASGDAAWITGHTLPVDGGYLANVF